MQSVGDSLVILHTKQLRDLGGLAGLTSVKEDFNIVDNKALNSLEGLQSLKATGAGGGGGGWGRPFRPAGEPTARLRL